MKTMHTLGLATSLALAALASTSAVAATWTYTSTGPASSSGLTATATALSALNNSTATIAATTAHYGGGLGVLSGTETTTSYPDHAMDNKDRIESILISFSDGSGGITSADKVNLSSVNIGWSYGDTDFSVYAYTGSATPSTTPLGLTYSNLTSNSWQLIGHYNQSGTGTFNIANTVYSSHWLIGAYNGLGSGMDKGDDYFKMASLTGNKCPTSGTIPGGCGGGGGTPGGVPEPGTLLLMGAGFLGLTRMARRKSA
jgi:hypothetical protein